MRRAPALSLKACRLFGIWYLINFAIVQIIKANAAFRFAVLGDVHARRGEGASAALRQRKCSCRVQTIRAKGYVISSLPASQSSLWPLGSGKGLALAEQARWARGDRVFPSTDLLLIGHYAPSQKWKQRKMPSSRSMRKVIYRVCCDAATLRTVGFIFPRWRRFHSNSLKFPSRDLGTRPTIPPPGASFCFSALCKHMLVLAQNPIAEGRAGVSIDRRHPTAWWQDCQWGSTKRRGRAAMVRWQSSQGGCGSRFGALATNGESPPAARSTDSSRETDAWRNIHHRKR